MHSREPWFAAKRYGYGAGLPIAWQGWAVLASYLTAMIATGLAIPLLWALPLFAAYSGALLYCAYRRTQGGWRWRDGD